MSVDNYVSFWVKIAGLTARIVTCNTNIADFFTAYRLQDASLSELDIHVTQQEIKQKRQEYAMKIDRNIACLSDSDIERVLILAAFSQYAVHKGRLLVHGSALCMDGVGYLFAAPSGTGKSTHAALWREAFGQHVTMINDDKPFLVCESDSLMVCGSPWNGKHKLDTNMAVPLKSISFINRAAENSIRQITPEAAFNRLLLQTYRPQTRQGQIATLQLLSYVCKKVSFYDLYCNMNPSAALTSYQGMR